ncbi:MAG TPA: hypothetical protein VG797_11610 [Phycisphaerales bacterium]|nr:hypothetical protein [Phycisphaerales bacterium]
MRISAMVVARCAGVVVPVAVFALSAGAQTLNPAFASDYTITDLGSVPALPPRYGGMAFKQGDPNTLLIGGFANAANGAMYAVSVVRDAENHITGFNGDAAYFADAAYNDGGVAYDPSGSVLFTSRWPVNQVGQLKPGSTATDKIIDLGALGVPGGHAALNFPPAGFPGSGRLKMSSWSGGEWFDARIVPDGTGTFDIVDVTQVTDATLPGGPEGFTYVPFGSTGFTHPSMLVSEYSAGNVAVYQMDSNGDPIVSSRQDFITGLSGAEGAVIDPMTGDFLFSTFGGGDRIVVVSGFEIPAPGAVSILALGGIATLRRRR